MSESTLSLSLLRGRSAVACRGVVSETGDSILSCSLAMSESVLCEGSVGSGGAREDGTKLAIVDRADGIAALLATESRAIVMPPRDPSEPRLMPGKPSVKGCCVRMGRVTRTHDVVEHGHGAKARAHRPDVGLMSRVGAVSRGRGALRGQRARRWRRRAASRASVALGWCE